MSARRRPVVDTGAIPKGQARAALLLALARLAAAVGEVEDLAMGFARALDSNTKRSPK
ncbi:MAG: hypothetical protein JOZ69_05395 [Myxococcales bacterium]|nr:hypothetical protein [Myxococcales bacterium]